MELVEVALTVRTALVSGVSVPTDNWSFVESQRKSADPEMDEDVSQKVTCPACPPVTVEGHAPSTHTRCPPSARRIPPTSRFPSNVDVEFCPFTFMNPANVELAVFAVSCPWTVVDAIAVMGPRMVVDPVFETEKYVDVAPEFVILK